VKQELLQKLIHPFRDNQVKQRQGPRGKVLDYIETHNVIARLNASLAGDWSFDIVEHQRLGDEVVVLGRLTVFADQPLVKTAFGSSRADGAPGDDLKAAASDALKKAATLLGVGLHLYDHDATIDSGVRDHGYPKPAETNAGPERISQTPRVTQSQLAKMHEIVDQLHGLDWPGFCEQVRRSRGANPEFLSRKVASQVLSRLIEEAHELRRGAA